MNRSIAVVCALALACPMAATAVANGAETPKPHAVVGTWQGSLPNGMGGRIRVVLKVQQTAEGALTATMDSPDQNASDIPVAKIALEELKVTLDVEAVRGSYEGTLDPAKDEIDGTWRQSGQELPLLLKKDAPKDPARD